ncbi:hypothetical protein PPM_p0056 (plasmid) [Paenibacillus polymyxa M1]|nr:hypothetical protein PPM_p0056 [Paenibacillus polymyxa M1]
MQADNVKELQLVIEYVELPFLLTILELNIKKIKESNFKLGPLFELHMRTMQDRVSKEQYRVRQEMRRRRIKVLEQHQLEDRITAK